MRETIVTGAQHAWAQTIAFLPALGLFLVILVAGYFVSKWIAKLVDKVLESVGFDRLVERGGIKRALEKTKYDASDILSKLVFYTLFLLVLQLAFGVFGPNPVSEILTRVIAFLPALFVSLLIVIVAAAVAKGVKDILQAVLAGLSYGKTLANIASAAVLIVGVFAAISHLEIAPAIVNGLFYAALAIVAGSAIVAIGGGGIEPMRHQWEKAMGRIEEEAPRLKEAAEGGAERAKAQAQAMKDKTQAEIQNTQAEQEAARSNPQRYQPTERSRPE